MMRNILSSTLAVTALLCLSGAAFAGQAGTPAGQRQVAQAGGGSGGGQSQIYGRQLMTQQEILQYRERMRNAKTAQERERIRLEHHKEMQERAQARGIQLPDEPPAGRGPGMGRGMGGSGRGMGGGGMGGGGMGGGRGR